VLFKLSSDENVWGPRRNY
jgi:hypothetical protein